MEFQPMVKRNGASNGSANAVGQTAGGSRQTRTIDDLAAEQGIGTVGSIDELAAAWPDDDRADSVDDFVRSLREWWK